MDGIEADHFGLEIETHVCSAALARRLARVREALRAAACPDDTSRSDVGRHIHVPRQAEVVQDGPLWGEDRWGFHVLRASLPTVGIQC